MGLADQPTMGTEREELNFRYQPDIKETNSPFKKKQTMELSFRNITYHARTFKWKKPFVEEKQILFGVNGDFSPGTLTAIMGPSGAGKTTLLNILAGFETSGSNGQVLINGRDRSLDGMKKFLRMSGYILQDSTLRDNLTVQESVMLAAELKLGKSVTNKDKQTQVEQLLQLLRLSKHVNTLSSMLSGGQKRRLSIAYELITNPPILFLDEPTTGLDSSSCSQCISILKMLASQGRTVITTIHQPSALIFEMFDNVYALADGQCIYNGPTSELVPYMAEKGLQCPIYHNPADFLLEVAIGEYGPVLDRLKLAPNLTTEFKKPGTHFNFPTFSLEELKEGIKKRKRLKSPEQTNSFFTEFYYLYVRNLILLHRGYRRRLFVTLSTFLCGTLLGITFYGAGNSAEMVRANLAFYFAILLFMVYVALMTVCVTLPPDLQSMGVEHFNQWYSLPPYYLSLLSIEIPLQAINIIVSMPLLYILSDQPMELFRIFAFLIIIIITSLTAQAFGFLVGAALPIRLGVFIGPIGSCILCVFGMGLRIKDTPYIFQLFAFASYVRSAFHSLAFSMYGFGRAQLDCKTEIYCHFKAPEKLLQEMDISFVDIYSNFTFIIAVCIFIHCVTYIILHRKVSKH